MAGLFNISGRVALVTGASSGIGYSMAKMLALNGVKVAVAARRLDRLESLVEEIREGSGTAIPVELDVMNLSSIYSAVDSVEKSLGPIQILVNNAGVAVSSKAINHSVDEFDAVLGTNLRGPWILAKETAKQMIRTNTKGSIINITSLLGVGVTSDLSSYCASKAGLNHVTKALALEWARHGIRVNAIAPGYIQTDINKDFFKTPAGDRMIARVPQRRIGHTSDLEGPLLLLASDASAFMTGVVLPVDGGHLCASL